MYRIEQTTNPFLIPTQKYEDLRQVFNNELPMEMILLIFSYLNLTSLARSCCVNKKWNLIANDSLLWSQVFYREIAFGNNKWAQKFGEKVVEDESQGEDFATLHLHISSIIEDYRRFQKIWPEKQVKHSLQLIWIPKTLNGQLNLKRLGEMVKPYFLAGKENGYGFILSSILENWGEQSIKESCWALMTDVLPKSRNKNYISQLKIIAALANKQLIGYESPTTLEAAVCILAGYFNSSPCLFSNKPATLTRCQEKEDGYQIIVGRCSSEEGLEINYDSDDDEFVGAAALRKFRRLSSQVEASLLDDLTIDYDSDAEDDCMTEKFENTRFKLECSSLNDFDNSSDEEDFIEYFSFKNTPPV